MPGIWESPVMYGFTSHSVLEAAGWAMDGAVGASHPRISLQYRYGWETGHGHEVTADGGAGNVLTDPKPGTKAKRRKAAPAGMGLRRRG